MEPIHLKWMIDTNAIIHLNREEYKYFRKNLNLIENEICLSKITVLEYPKSLNFNKIFKIIDLNPIITNKALELILQLRENGELVPIPDLLIMASAEVKKVPFIISNDKHFTQMLPFTKNIIRVITIEDFIQTQLIPRKK